MKNFRRAILSLEYAFLIAMVVLAIITMASYTRRALNSRWRDVGDSFGQGRLFDSGTTIR